ncbi:MAG: DivIVA domain-containing protein [Cytophagales bacterium]
MKISPIDIRQKGFEKKFRGYDVEEVDAYLNSLSIEWQRLLDENKELRLRFENAEKEVHKLREVESTLFKTLKTAEDTGNNIVDQANKQAELILKQAKFDADSLVNEAKLLSKNLVDEAESESKLLVKNAQEELKAINSEHRELEIKKDNILQELRNIANDLSERVERYKTKAKIELFNKFDEKPSPKIVEKQPIEKIETIELEINEKNDGSDNVVVEEEEQEEEVVSKPNPGGSFFDSI